MTQSLKMKLIICDLEEILILIVIVRCQLDDLLELKNWHSYNGLHCRSTFILIRAVVTCH